MRSGSLLAQHPSYAGDMSDEPATDPRPWFGRRVYDFLFRFLGPAQLGSNDQPPTRAADQTYLCPVCGHEMSEHSYQVSDGRKRMTCPAPPLHEHA